MPIPLKITTYDVGAGGIPTTTNPRDLSGWIDSYQDSILNELGCESCRLTGRVRSIEEAVDWTQRLMAAIEVYTPTGRPRFFGFLHEVSIPALECSVSLTDMANAVIVRYTDPDGKKGTSTATNSGSIAQFGRKELVLNFSTAYAAEATNRAATVLAQLAYPPNKETVSVEKVDGGDGVAVELTFRGWAEALKWLTTSSTTTATAVTSTQVTTLLTAYNSANAFFDTTGAQVVSTGFSATQYCDPDTTYFERIATLLAAGNSSQQRVAWGFYTRAITIATAASATPDTIAYYYSKRTRELRDVYSNVIPVWDWAPDVMIQNVDAIEPPFPTGTIATLTKKYIKRVTLSIDKDGKVSGTLEPDDPDKLPEFLAKPVSVTSGVSARHAQIEARIARAAKTRTIAADNTTIYNPGTGTLNPAAGGTGVSNPGTITAPSDVDLGTGVGIGGAGSSAALGTGTAGRVAEWASSSTLQASTLIKSGAGVLTLSASGAFTLTVPATGTATLGTGTSGRVTEWGGTNTVQASTLVKSGAGVLTLSASGTATLTIDSSTRLDGAGASSGDVLTYNGTAYAPATPSYAPVDAKYIVQTSNSTLTNEQSLGALSTGLLKSTTTTGVLSIAVVGTDYLDGSGTSGRVAQWGASNALADSTLVKSGAGVLTLSASGAFTLTVPATGTAALGTGVSNRFAFWSGTNTLTSDTKLTYDSGNDWVEANAMNVLGVLNVGGSSTISGGLNVGSASGAGTGDVRGNGVGKFDAGLATVSNNAWTIGGFTATALTISGYVTVTVDGTVRKLAVVT